MKKSIKDFLQFLVLGFPIGERMEVIRVVIPADSIYSHRNKNGDCFSKGRRKNYFHNNKTNQ
jgi:hypothetical protein